MPADKLTETLIEALKQSLADASAQRLFRSGKLDGLFASRTGTSGEAAAQAIRDGLVEVVKTENKGKTIVEWVRLTPAGVNFLHEHESPRQALEDLRAILQVNREQVPVWLNDVRQELQALGNRLVEEAQRWTHRLDTLSARVEEALRRAELADPQVQDATVPWAQPAIQYLDRRREQGASGDCPLPELFAALRRGETELSVIDFHDGLRRLQDRRAVRLLPFTGAPSELPEPEYALLDGNVIHYYAAR